MRAPVYRFVDARNTLLGLAFPGEVIVFLSAAWPALIFLAPSLALVAIVSAYAAIRLITRGRAESFIQHWVWWRARQIASRGMLSAAARARVPGYPFGDLLTRDLGPRSARG
jgi:hypothetical protein